MPATFVITPGGPIAVGFLELDYRLRLDPGETILALESLAQAEAA